MAKKRASKKSTPAEQKNLIEDVDALPEELQLCADAHKKNMVSHSRLAAKKRASRDTLIESMKKHGISRVPIMVDGNRKVFVIHDEAKLTIEVPKKPVEPDGDDEL